jgi:undecaprenyl-diphosphatase
VLLLRRYEGAQALRLSFLMSIPAVLAAQVGLALLEPVPTTTVSLIALAASFALGLATVHVLMRLAQRLNFGIFCIFLGALAMLSLLL